MRLRSGNCELSRSRGPEELARERQRRAARLVREVRAALQLAEVCAQLLVPMLGGPMQRRRALLKPRGQGKRQAFAIWQTWLRRSQTLVARSYTLRDTYG